MRKKVCIIIVVLSTCLNVFATKREWLSSPLCVSIQKFDSTSAVTPLVKWQLTPSGGECVITLTSEEKERAEHVLRVRLPIAAKGCLGFASTREGVVDLKERPLYHRYGDRDAILPLMSVMDTCYNQALTVAVDANYFLPDLKMKLNENEMEFIFSKIGLGNSRSSQIRLCFYTHEADYRAAIKSYSTEFPEWFFPKIDRSPTMEGGFWYHHIMEMPPIEELNSQGIKAIWSSFYFEVMGQFLPMDENEESWKPYTYLRTWSRQKYAGTDPIKELMSYDKINHFTDRLLDNGIGHYVYFNFNEYGGISANKEIFNQRLQNEFALSIQYNEHGIPREAWEGSYLMNPDTKQAFGKHLIEQAKLHVEKTPRIKGFCVDQLNHESAIDFSGKQDGITMVGNKEVFHLGKAIQDIEDSLCHIAHERNMQVFINNSWKLASMKNIDGYFYEFPEVRMLSYCAPYRPVAGWHHLKDYYGTDDLIQFEANLKRRLKYGVFSHYIASSFKIAQQRPDKEAAEMMQTFSPLFEKLAGKEQVLEPHCIAVSGANETNLFRNQKDEYIIPVISRIRFLSRNINALEKVKIKLHIPDASRLKWAYVYSDKVKPYRAKLEKKGNDVIIIMDKHYSASIVVAGETNEPVSNYNNQQSVSDNKVKIKKNNTYKNMLKIDYLLNNIVEADLQIYGQYVDDGKSFAMPLDKNGSSRGNVTVYVGDTKIGELIDNNKSGFQGLIQRKTDKQTFRIPLGILKNEKEVPYISFRQTEEESWFAFEKVKLVFKNKNGIWLDVAEWMPDKGTVNHAINTNIIAPEIIIQLHNTIQKK